jgi:asparagine synthase (glutamine-hydrolysing)
MLRAQHLYGRGRPSVSRFEGGSFGIDLYPTVPEDSFDRQPLRMQDRLLVADIRIDNRDEIAAALGIAAEEKQECSDSELLLRAWIRWGETSLERIAGDYAFALFDAAERKLVLGRDGVGERPLFFAADGRTVAFASMPSGILALPRFRRGFDMDSLACAAGDVRPSGDRTYFAGIHRVLPGRLTEFTAACARSRSHWQPLRDNLRFHNQEEYVEAYRSVLDDAVRPRLRRLSGPVAAHLSSGLDSSAVAATAGRLSGGEHVVAFTAAPAAHFEPAFVRGRIADESRAASLTAKMHALRHIVVRNSGSGISHLRSLVRTSQEPHCNIVNFGWADAIEGIAQNEGSRILLSGEFGNVTLNAGGLNVLGDMIASRNWREWWNEARAAVQADDIHWRGVLINSFEPWLPRPLNVALYRRRFASGPRSRSVYLTKAWIRRIRRRLDDAFLLARSGDTTVDRMGLIPIIENGTLRKGSLARHGIDNRSPLGDRRIVEFSLQLPPNQLFFQGRSRPLARTALADRVPAGILNQKVRGYQAADWSQSIDTSELREMVDEIACSSTVRELIDVPKLRRTIENWPNRFDGFRLYQQLAVDLPAALATGLFILEAEKWLAGNFD